MITVPQIVQELIEQTPFLEEGLSLNIINYSALSRIWRPIIEKRLMKRIEEGSILMALKRYSEKRTNNPPSSRLGRDFGGISAPGEVLPGNSRRMGSGSFKKNQHFAVDMIVRSHVIEFTFKNSDNLFISHKKLLDSIGHMDTQFVTITQGIYETTVIASKSHEKIIRDVFRGCTIISEFQNLSTITIRLTNEVVQMSGIYYLILKCLAWNNINVIEVVSTYSEFTIILEEHSVNQAFSLLTDLIK